MTWTSNVNPNPSFELNLTGYTALPNTILQQTFVDAFAGRASMAVTTAGLGSGEGFYGPAVEFPVSGPGSLSASFSGPGGQVQVSAVVNPGGIVLASQTLLLTNQWQTVQLNGLNIVSGTSLYILVRTLTPQVLAFMADAIQYEPESPAHAYCDGDQPGCYWTGTPQASSSYQPVQFPVSMTGGIQMAGTITVIQRGAIIPVTLPSASIVSGGPIPNPLVPALANWNIGITVIQPPGAFDDFALFETGDVDPALSYAGWNNALKTSGTTSYNRNWGIFYPPLDYVASDGTNMWNRAAYVAMGHEFVNIPAGAAQNMTLMQVEKMPLAGTSGLDQTPAPGAYDTPRSIHTIIKPTRLNYCTNPSFEANSVAGWTPAGTATFVLTHTVASVNSVPIGQLTDTWSCQVTPHSAADGARLSIPNLIFGDTYTASIYALPGASTAAIALTVGTSTGTTAQQYDAFGHPADLTPGTWVRASVTFVATASTMVLTVTPVLSALPAASYQPFSLDCCLIEAGEIAGTYFDANFGADYLWETGGAANLARSYYYENYAINQSVITDILSNHTPLGITPAMPLYGICPTK